jgi:hypothetical protein
MLMGSTLLTTAQRLPRSFASAFAWLHCERVL